MRGSIVSDAPGEDLASDAEPPRSEPSTLTPDWLQRLTGRTGAPGEQVVRLPRARGTTAGVARWVAVASRSRAHHERSAEREACWWVATHLAEADRDLDVALEHARRALELGGDDAWRMQVSTWLERMGKHREAAAVVAPSVAQVGTAREAARLLVRMARLQIRADEHQLAMQNLLEAATVWPAYADALDLAGDLAAAKGQAETASMLLEAADRHEQNGNLTRSFEARRRAFEAAPSNVQACNALCDVLERAERAEAADGIRRAHAAALDPLGAKATHVARLMRALELGAPVRALTAVVDGRLESDADPEVGRAVDDALEGVGLHDAVMARWELSVSRKRGAERARVLVELAGLYLGRLAAPDRAIEAWIEALAADPSCGEARAALRTHARSMHDQSAWAEGLIRAIRTNPDAHTTIECLRELATLAEDRLSEPSLAAWAYDELGRRGASDDAMDKARTRLSPRVRLQDGALAAAQEAVEQGDSEARVEGWRRLAAILRGRPDELERYLDVLANLVRTGQGERRWWVDFERAAVRAGRVDLLEEVTRACLEQGVSRADVLHLRTTLLLLAWRRGDAAATMCDAQALAADLPGTRLAYAHAWIAASVQHDDEARAQALENLANNQNASVRGTMLALAGEIHNELGHEAQASRLAELAQQTDDSAPRVLLFLADQGSRRTDESCARYLEKLVSIYLPSSQHHAQLVAAFDNSGVHDLAHAWVRRWIELRPWDPEVAARLIDTADRSSATDSLATAITRLTTCPLSSECLEPVLCRGLTKIAQHDTARAAAVGRDLGDLFGVRRQALRELLIELAGTTGDTRYEARVLERWMACPEAPNDPNTWLRLFTLYRQMEETEAAARALARAARAQAAPTDVLAGVETLGDAPSGDAALSLLEARAVAHQAQGAMDLAAEAWLSLGSARWERADDRIGAIEAWAAGLGGGSATAFALLSESLADFANGEIATAAIRDFGLASNDTSKQASALIVAAARSLALGQFRSTLDLAILALRQDPRRTDALVIIERASESANAPEAVDEAHAVAATGAKGRFGRRAAHLRAARTLEERNRPELAVVHAMAAFEADPVQGSALVMMLRLADQVDAADVIDTLVRVAEQASHNQQRAYWWLHAARVAAGHPDHVRRGLDLSLRALSATPSIEAVELMHEVMERLLAAEAEDAATLELRLQRAHKAIAPRLEGPVGARIALAAATLGAQVLRAAPAAMAWMTTALGCSGDVDEYERLLPHASLLAMDEEAAKTVIDEALSRTVGVRGTTGPALLALGRALARALGDSARDAKLADAERGGVAKDTQPQVDPFSDLADELSADSEHPPTPARQAPDSHDTENTEPLDPLAAAEQLEARGELAAAIDLATKAQLLVEVASLWQARGNQEAARAAWQIVAEVDPTHRDAWLFLERDAGDRGEFGMLAQILARRAMVTTSLEERRALGLRRARVLDMELGLADQARSELDALTEKLGANAEVLGFRAELAQRSGGPLAAAPFWTRAAAVLPNRMEAIALACRAARAYLDAKDEGQARDALTLIGSHEHGEVLSLWIEIDRRFGESSQLGDHLDAWAACAQVDNETRARALLEAAELAKTQHDADKTVDRARRAAELAPLDATVQLRCAFLIYRVEGLANREHVVEMFERLSASMAVTAPEDQDLHAYLTAECLDVIKGPEQAIEHLNERKRIIGIGPLIALGLADRMAAMGNQQVALPLFELALRGNDLMGVRTRVQVAFAAARAALRVGGKQLAAPYIAVVDQTPGAEELMARLRKEMSSPSAPPQRPTDSSTPPPGPSGQEPSLTSTISSQPPPMPVSSTPLAPEVERKLFEALAAGDVAAGDQLASMLTGDPNRTQDVAAIRRRQVVFQPCSTRALELLRDAARADRNPAHAAAVHHIVCTLTGQPAPPPPPLQQQSIDPQRLLAMVGRGVHGAASEVLGAIWTNASHLFVRDPASYGLTGLERVAISAPSPVGRAYATAAPVFGLGKTPVFQRRTHGPMTLAVAALDPMSVVVHGDVGDNDELLYRMAAMLVATTPANGMLFGLPANAIKQLMKALLAAFGPPDASRNRVSESAVLAGELWRALPGTVQRRFGELYRQAEPFTYEDAWARALQSTRRAGLFVVGNLKVALDDVMNDPGIRDRIDVGAADAYRSLCRVSVSAADLLRFASSTEFAEVRWREATRHNSGGMRNVRA